MHVSGRWKRFFGGLGLLITALNGPVAHFSDSLWRLVCNERFEIAKKFFDRVKHPILKRNMIVLCLEPMPKKSSFWSRHATRRNYCLHPHLSALTWTPAVHRCSSDICVQRSDKMRPFMKRGYLTNRFETPGTAIWQHVDN